MALVLDYWTLDEALALIRPIQEDTRKFGFHLSLGGGVLNKGYSKKDLDLYFLPYENTRGSQDAQGLITWLDGMWGKGQSMRSESNRRRDRRDSLLSRESDDRVRAQIMEAYPDPKDSLYSAKRKYRYSDLRVDVFVLGGERVKEEEREEPSQDFPEEGGLSRGGEMDAWGRFVDSQQPATPNRLAGLLGQPAVASTIGSTTITTGTWGGVTRSDQPIFRSSTPQPSRGLDEVFRSFWTDESTRILNEPIPLLDTLDPLEEED